MQTGRTTVAVIPARNAARRFPGKPLVELNGVPMVVHVARQARAASHIDDVVVATDEVRIQTIVQQFGFRAEMTPDCPTGTDRVARLIADWNERPDLVVNLQCDEPLIDPRDIDRLVSEMASQGAVIGTLARRCEDETEVSSPNVVKVVRTPEGRALYFSRAPIPYGAPSSHILKHVGLYIYRPEVLFRFARLSRGALESLERLEQLRALENGIPIHVTMCVSERPSFGVDVPGDVDRVVRELSRQSSRTESLGSAD